jgi:hypothetical protein
VGTRTSASPPTPDILPTTAWISEGRCNVLQWYEATTMLFPFVAWLQSWLSNALLMDVLLEYCIRKQANTDDMG